jgi:predicted AlkP superfamily pyrophosphatase or phosphodiesterase
MLAVAVPTARAAPATPPAILASGQETDSTMASMERPRLVVVIPVDQLRPDYLDRFSPHFLPARSASGVGGFRWLMEYGARYLDAHQDHLATETGPGHAAILTGAFPYKHGIIANSWFDRAMGRERNCVEDPASPQVGVQREIRGASPWALMTSTLGDELKMAAGERAKVWSVSYKDRSAIFMGGHLADGVLWFDRSDGEWVTSRYYARDGKLPAFVTAWNERHLPNDHFGTKWELSIPEEALPGLWPPGAGPGSGAVGLGGGFPHRLDGGGREKEGHAPHSHEDPGEAFFSAFIASPFGNEHILATAKQIIGTQRLGKDDVPDLIAVGLSTNDYTGHIFGPHSPEVADVTVRLDGQLADFFAFLDRTVDGGLDRVTVVLTADHGVAPIIPSAVESGMPGGNYDVDAIQASVDAALDLAFGPRDWVLDIDASWIYLDHKAITDRRLDRGEVERAAAEAARKQPGIYEAWTRTMLEEGRLPRTDLGLRASRSFHPGRSGDVLLVEAPYWVGTWARTGATHGSPYGYDTSVPLLIAGAGVRPGVYRERASTTDIAPTLAAILAIPAPSGSEGGILRCYAGATQ